MSIASSLIVHHLTKTYYSGMWPFLTPSFTAVNGISFELGQEEILGMLGPNGAGKTTTIQMLLGLLTPTKGSISYFGKNFFKNRTDILKSVAYASGYDKLPPRLNVWDNLDVYGRLYGVCASERKKRITELLQFFNMWHLRKRQAGALSAGQRTRIILCKAFIARPLVVLLDEPTASLDPDVAQDVRSFVLDQRKKYGTSVLLTSHNMAEVTALCDRVLMLKQGNIIADNTPAALAASVSVSHVRLLIKEKKESCFAYLKENSISFSDHGHELLIDIEEDKIATLLTAFAHRGVEYVQISIDKPTLEDYFLTTIKKQ